MKLKLIYKSFNTPNVKYVKGDILVVDREYGEYLLLSFPLWFEKIESVKETMIAKNFEYYISKKIDDEIEEEKAPKKKTFKSRKVR